MPRRGGGVRGRNWNNGGDGSRGNSYNEHDTRGHGDNVRRVSFKSNSNKINKNKNKNWDAAIKNLDEDDIDMSGQAFGRGNNNGIRGNFRLRGRRDGRVNSPAPRQNFVPRRLIPGQSPWYQVMIPYGQKHEKSLILSTLLNNLSPDVFVPHFYNIVGNAAIFYIDDFALAEKINNLDRKISMPDGFRLIIKVKSGTPNVNIDSKVQEKMKLAMAGRYNPAAKALDLTKFHSDPGLLDVFCALFRPAIMLAAVDIIAENIPDLEALNLNDNKIQILDHLKSLLKKLPNLKILYLANNRIQSMTSLESLVGLPLVDMQLSGNPMSERFKEKDSYVREVRKKFPKLLQLDGVILPPVIGFDVTDELKCPPPRASFICNPGGQGVVKQFLEQYFALYDSESRQPLLDAYHEQAMFSMCASYGQNQNTHNRLSAYMTNSRNLMRISDREGRRKHLKQGRLQVVAFLNDLPKTQHDPHSFTVDLTVCTPVLMCLTVNGVFRETCESSSSTNPSSPVLRSFHKTMIIVPQGDGFCIKNDMLFIANASTEQEENSFKPPRIVNQQAPPPYMPPQVHQTEVPVPASPSVETQLQMIQAFAMQTNMNAKWSSDCLVQTNWDYQRAALVFTELHKQGQIPPDAFAK